MKIYRTTASKVQCILYFIVLDLIAVGFTTSGQETGHPQGNQKVPLERYVRDHMARKKPKTDKQPVLAFFIKFINFGCIPCLNGFFELSDSLNSKFKAYGKRDVVLFFVRDKRPEEDQYRLMKGWARSNGMHFPIYLAPPEVFDDYNMDYTTVVLLSKDNEPELIETFPLTLRTTTEIIHKLFPDEK